MREPNMLLVVGFLPSLPRLPIDQVHHCTIFICFFKNKTTVLMVLDNNHILNPSVIRASHQIFISSSFLAPVKSSAKTS